MVSTRSKRNATKHEAPKAEREVPAKKQKLSEDAKKAEEDEKAEEVSEKDESMKDVEPEPSNGNKEENGKPEAPEPEAAKSEPQVKAPETKDKGIEEPEAAESKAEEPEKESKPLDGDAKENGKPSADEPEAAKAEHQTTGGAQRDSKEAESPVLEKGVFYFFFRPRVNTEDVSSLNDVQKSYLLLRPTKSAVSSAKQSLRMIQIPKKALPATGTHERFLAFVISSDESIKDLKDDIGESHYSTATRGERLQPAARPVAEGVYAIIGDPDGRTTHFAYLLTLPASATEVQKEFGLNDQGSFIMSTRNPATPAPPQARGLQDAQYPEKIKEQFRGRRWMNLLPEHLDYPFTQLLFIGEKLSITGEEAIDQLEKLEEEDEVRVNHLKGDNAVYKDLELSKKEFLPGALHGELE